MQFFNGKSGTVMVGAGNGAPGQSGSFGVQGSSTTWSLGSADLLKYIEQLMANVKEEKLSRGETEGLSEFNQVEYVELLVLLQFFWCLDLDAYCSCFESLG